MEHAQLCADVRALVGHILPAENNAAAGDGIAGVAHQGAHQGGFARAVVAHQNMGLAGVDGQVQAVQKHLLLLADRDL